MRVVVQVVIDADEVVAGVLTGPSAYPLATTAHLLEEVRNLLRVPDYAGHQASMFIENDDGSKAHTLAVINKPDKPMED